MPDSLSDHLKKRPEYRDASRKARLSYLYSDLSQARINNPTSYASSVSWWITLLEEIVSKGLQDGGADVTETTDKLVWHLDQSFLDRLRWDGAGRPTGLGTVTVSSNIAYKYSVPVRLTPDADEVAAPLSPVDAYVSNVTRHHHTVEGVPNFHSTYCTFLLAGMASFKDGGRTILVVSREAWSDRQQ